MDKTKQQCTSHMTRGTTLSCTTSHMTRGTTLSCTTREGSRLRAELEMASQNHREKPDHRVLSPDYDNNNGNCITLL